jgi:hypothetical protein
MPNYNFRQDLPIAKKTEQEVAGLLALKYGAKIISFKDNNEYDVLMEVRGVQIKIEIKEDFTCERTGNVGLEYFCRGKPSGISVSQADFYIYKLHTKNFGIVYVMHSVAKLRKMIEDKKYFWVVNGGDKGSNSMNYLFKYDEFVKTGKILPLDKNQVV